MTVYRIRVILFEREPGCWVAQCLEHDIGAQASNLPDLAYNFERSVVGHIAVCEERGIEPFSDLGEVPHEYFEMWYRATLCVELSPESRFVDGRQVEQELKVAA